MLETIEEQKYIYFFNIEDVRNADKTKRRKF